MKSLIASDSSSSRGCARPTITRLIIFPLCYPQLGIATLWTLIAHLIIFPLCYPQIGLCVLICLSLLFGLGVPVGFVRCCWSIFDK